MKRTLKFKGDWSIETSENEDDIRIILHKKPKSISLISQEREMNAQEILDGQ